MAHPNREDVPLFPLGVVLYPGERAPLHIFEHRYRELVRYCLETGEPFGVVLTDDDRMAEVGSLVQIERVLQRYEDGRLDILVRALERIRIVEVHQERVYLTATTRSYETLDPLPEPAARERVITLHMKLLELAGEKLRPSLYEGSKRVSFVIAQNAGLDLPRKQELLELRSEQERLRYLADHLEQIIPEVKRLRERMRRVRSNGHFNQED